MKSSFLSILMFEFAISCLQSCNKKNDIIYTPDNKYASSISLPKLTVYAAPKGAPQNETFSVFVKYEGGEWINLYPYDAEVDGGYLATPIYHMAFVSFDADFSKKIEVEVIKKSGSVSNFKILPDFENDNPTLNGDTLILTLTSPQKISVQINGDLHNNLMIFANNNDTIENDTIERNNPSIQYFGPGVHLIGGDGKGTISLNSNQMIYIAGGAIVYGKIIASNANNISIQGRGILCGGMFTDHAYPHSVGEQLINISNSTNVSIRGITLLNTVSWNIHLEGCDDVICDNLKIMGWTINSDGIDPAYSSNVTINDCFVRNYDDCISIKLDYGLGNSLNAKGSRNITIQNCVLWSDQGRSILIGPESYSTVDKNFENIIVSNIDVLYDENYSTDWAKGVLSINLGDGATTNNVTFNDIRVNTIGSETNLITISILQSPYNISPGQRIQNVSFNRVSLNCGLNIKNIIHGYDESRIVDGVHFKDLKINGLYIKNDSDGGFDINPFTSNINFFVTK